MNEKAHLQKGRASHRHIYQTGLGTHCYLDRQQSHKHRQNLSPIRYHEMPESDPPPSVPWRSSLAPVKETSTGYASIDSESLTAPERAEVDRSLYLDNFVQVIRRWLPQTREDLSLWQSRAKTKPWFSSVTAKNSELTATLDDLEEGCVRHGWCFRSDEVQVDSALLIRDQLSRLTASAASLMVGIGPTEMDSAGAVSEVLHGSTQYEVEVDYMLAELGKIGEPLIMRALNLSLTRR